MGKDVYKEANDFLNRYPLTVAWRINQHAKIMNKHLNPDEEIFYLFVGQRNANPLDIFSSCIVALTNKRIMVVQKRVIPGYTLKSITPDLFNDFSVYKGIIWGKVYIDTVKEFLAISNIDPKALPEIETSLSEYLLKIKERYKKSSESSDIKVDNFDFDLNDESYNDYKDN